MALTTNKKNKIIAEWKVGKYPSYNAVAVAYKIDPKTVKKILDGIEQSNVYIVEDGARYEIAKKSIKNPNEIKAIENRVKELSIADEVEIEAFGATLDNIRSVRKKIQLEEVENMQDHRHAQATIDQALITVGKAARHAPRTEIKQENNSAIQNNISVEDISRAIADGLPD